MDLWEASRHSFLLAVNCNLNSALFAEVHPSVSLAQIMLDTLGALCQEPARLFVSDHSLCKMKNYD